MPTFDLAELRRYPDVEAPNLFAVDASDRLILDEAADALAAAPSVTVLEDNYGALTLGAAALHGARDIRVYQDSLLAARALEANAREAGLADTYRSLPLAPELLEGATAVLMQLPKSLDELDELAAAVAAWASPTVTVFAGGRVKHMTPAMNDVLGRYFERVDVTHARQKSRVLIASGRRPNAPESTYPKAEFHTDLGLWVHASGAAFAGPRIDIGTRALLAVLDQVAPDAERAIDLGCGTGVLAASLAGRRPGIRVIASDQSAGAVRSAQATMAANGLDDRVTVVRDDALDSQPDASADLVLLNPPFHVGSTVHTGLASRLFASAARVLAPGGELWTVYNSHLGYRGELSRTVGHTREVSRNTKFTVTVSRKASS